jgi:hypothetical protein
MVETIVVNKVTFRWRRILSTGRNVPSRLQQDVARFFRGLDRVPYQQKRVHERDAVSMAFLHGVLVTFQMTLAFKYGCEHDQAPGLGHEAFFAFMNASVQRKAT